MIVTPQEPIPRRRTALALSAGAMFGAYQAGAWKALAPRFEPDAVYGASVGSLNGWAIAGGVPPDLLSERWMRAEAAGQFRFQLPKHWLDGVLRVPFLEEWIQEMVAHSTPRVEYALVMTRTWPLRPELVRGPEVTWRHLASSCAMPVLFPHYRLNGAVYTDGGLMQAMPLWPLRALGCDRAVAVNCLPTLPFPGGRLASRLMRRMSRHDFSAGSPAEVICIQPAEPLGNADDFLRWKPRKIERWMEQGYHDATAVLQAHPEFFRPAEAPVRGTPASPSAPSAETIFSREADILSERTG
jgi:NTE family protein